MLLALVIFVNNRSGPTLTGIVASAFVLSLFALGVYAVRYLYSRYVATEEGIERRGPLGGAQHISWPDAAQISTPKLFFKGLARVRSNRGDSITIPKGLPGYSELLDVICAQAPLLRGRQIPADVWPRRVSWASAWIAIVVVLISLLFLKLLYTILARPQ